MGQNSLRVLVVDDEKIVRDFFKHLLAFMGIEVSEAQSGAEALEQVGRSPFDLYFIDVRMPGMNGLETYRAIRRAHPQALAVMMTGYAVEDLLTQAEKEGVASHIHKPFDISQIKEVIAKTEEEKKGMASLRVLVIDDDKAILDFLSGLLANKDASCKLASNRSEALAFLQNEKFDLVFLDLMLQDTNGMELHREITSRMPQVPVILMSGYPQKLKEATGKMDLAGCLYKPFEVREIMSFLELAKAKKHE
ncbi:MAG: response regulator [Candidatus Omnitrophica bacterium]|nr:response regulator [Candidatus Omnitrophota bacterium]